MVAPPLAFVDPGSLPPLPVYDGTRSSNPDSSYSTNKWFPMYYLNKDSQTVNVALRNDGMTLPNFQTPDGSSYSNHSTLTETFR